MFDGVSECGRCCTDCVMVCIRSEKKDIEVTSFDGVVAKLAQDTSIPMEEDMYVTMIRPVFRHILPFSAPPANAVNIMSPFLGIHVFLIPSPKPLPSRTKSSVRRSGFALRCVNLRRQSVDSDSSWDYALCFCL